MFPKCHSVFDSVHMPPIPMRAQISCLKMLDCVGEKWVPEDSLLQTLAFAAWTINRAIEICDGGGLLLSKRRAREAADALHQHLRSFQYLACHHGVEDTPFMFRMTPKAHYIWHQAVQTRQWRINPFLFHCFGEESWLGKIKCIAKQCHGRTMTSRIIARYLICLALYLENHRRRSKDIASNGWGLAVLLYNNFHFFYHQQQEQPFFDDATRPWGEATCPAWGLGIQLQVTASATSQKKMQQCKPLQHQAKRWWVLMETIVFFWLHFDCNIFGNPSLGWWPKWFEDFEVGQPKPTHQNLALSQNKRG